MKKFPEEIVTKKSASLGKRQLQTEEKKRLRKSPGPVRRWGHLVPPLICPGVTPSLISHRGRHPSRRRRSPRRRKGRWREPLIRCSYGWRPIPATSIPFSLSRGHIIPLATSARATSLRARRHGGLHGRRRTPSCRSTLE